MGIVRDFCQDFEIGFDLSFFFTFPHFLHLIDIVSKKVATFYFSGPYSRLGGFGNSDIALLGGEQAKISVFCLL